MGVSLKKREKVSLKKNSNKKFLIGLGWKANTGFFKSLFNREEYDLDAACCIVRDSGSKEYVYYNNLWSSDGSIHHMGDNLVGGNGKADDEQIIIDTSKIDRDVNTIYIGVNIYQAVKRLQSFSNVKDAYIRIAEQGSGTDICEFRLTNGEFNNCHAVIMGCLHREDDSEWQFEAYGDGIKNVNAKTMFDKYN